MKYDWNTLGWVVLFYIVILSLVAYAGFLWNGGVLR